MARHVLIFHSDPSIARMLATVCEVERFGVTTTHTVDDTLMMLRSSLHPLVAVADHDHCAVHPDPPFYGTIRDYPDTYGQHRHIAIHWWQLSDEDEALLDELGVSRLQGPFPIQDFVTLLEEAAGQL